MNTKTYYKPLLAILICISTTGYLMAQSQQNKVIVIPKGFPVETAADFVTLLKSSTRADWIFKEELKSDAGILLTLVDDKKFRTKESFHLVSNGQNKLTITSSSFEGLIFGFYKHLRNLGFKFYLPDSLYTHIPQNLNPFGNKTDKYDQPYLQVRQFFGTGGFGTTNPDPDLSVQKAWNLWKNRNGFGASYQLGGHRGENFILENKEILKRNPSWLVSPLSGNDHADQQIKLNYPDKNAMEYFTNWSIQPFLQKNYRPLPASHSDFISLEPSDGGGFLNELPGNKEKKLPSISDQVYSAANLAAQKLDKHFPNHPNIGVNLYAYSSHAAPPSFPLHPRVFVQIIPYQFQNIAYGPAFIKMWSEKARRFALYDYLKYTDASFDLPGGMSLEEIMKRLFHSVQNGSEGTTYETSYSKFSTGIPLYIIGRYMADGDENWQLNLEQLTRDLYPKAETPIKEIFNLFYNEPAFSLSHFGNALAALKSADALVKEPIARQRITELKQYLQFVHLVYRSRETSKGRLDQRILPVAEYAWSLYESRIIHSYRIMQLVSYAFLNSDKSDKNYALFQKLHADWFPETKRTESAWNKISQGIDRKRTDTEFSKILPSYPSSAIAVPYAISDVVSAISGQYMPVNKMVIGGDAAARGYFGIYSAKPSEIRIRYILNDAGQPSVIVSALDKNYRNTQALRLTQKKGETIIKIPAGETSFFINAANNTVYRMEVTIPDGLFFFDGAPRGIMAFYKNLNDPWESYTYSPEHYPSYFFMPSGISSVNYQVQLNALTLTNASGKKVLSRILSTEHGGLENRELTVAPDETKKIWKAVIDGNYNYGFKNIPDRYFLLKKK